MQVVPKTENVQIFPPAGFISLLSQSNMKGVLFSISFGCCIILILKEYVSAWNLSSVVFILYQRRTEKGRLLMYSIFLLALFVTLLMQTAGHEKLNRTRNLAKTAVNQYCIPFLSTGP